MLHVKRVFALVLVLVLGIMLTAPLAGAADSVTVIGQVAMEGESYVLVTDSGKFLLDGIDESLEGKKVSVTGTVEDGENGEKWLVVESAEEVK